MTLINHKTRVCNNEDCLQIYTYVHSWQILHVIRDRIPELRGLRVRFWQHRSMQHEYILHNWCPIHSKVHLFIFMNFTNFSICAASKCIYNIAASYLRQYNLCKSQADSRRGVRCTAAPIKVASNAIFLIPPPQPIPISILCSLLLQLHITKLELLQKNHIIFPNKCLILHCDIK